MNDMATEQWIQLQRLQQALHIQQAFIQFSDVDTASAARNALDGRSILRYLLPEHVGTSSLRISYFAHTDMNIEFQSHRSRDYTKYLSSCKSYCNSSCSGMF